MRIVYLLVILFFLSCKPDPAHITPPDIVHYDINVPAGLPTMPVPEGNPTTVSGVALGRKLFFDKRLSANNTQSCASCHNQKFFFSDSSNRFSVGIDGISGTRNSMPLFNIGYSKRLMWDGAATSLENQARLPITNPIEMHESMENVVLKLQSDAQYPTLFKNAFGTETITQTLIFMALAQFERTLLSANSKFDQWRRGLVSLTPQEERGLQVYLAEDKGHCIHCHTYGSTFTDYDFKNTGLDSIYSDPGYGQVTGKSSDFGKFKTPSLRNVALTSPYMHDGRFTTLMQCVEHYNSGFHYSQNLAPELATALKNRMTTQDMEDLVVFLHTLTDTTFLSNTNFSAP